MSEPTDSTDRSIDGSTPNVIPKWGEFVDPNDITKGKYYPLHSYQRKIYEANNRFIAAVAGTGGGKTVVGALWTLRKVQEAIQKYGKCLGFIVAPTYKILSRATVPTFLDTISHTILGPQNGGRYLEAKNCYILPNDWGKVWCQGADNPEGLEGGQFDFVWADEGGQLSKKAFNAIVGRTGAKQGSILVTTTPYVGPDGFGPLHNEWYPMWLANDKNYYIVQFSSIENPTYPMEEYERAKRTMTAETFESRYDGKFTSVEGLVYPTFYRTHIEMKTQVFKKMLESPGKFIGGIDFGWQDPFAAICGFLSENEDFGEDVLYIWYERYRSMVPIAQHARSLPKFDDKTIIWFADWSPELIKTLKKFGHCVRRAKKRFVVKNFRGISAKIQMVNARILQGKLKVITSRAPALCAEAISYVYPSKEEEIIGELPVDKDNHAMDALGYLITGIDIHTLVA